MLCHFLDKNMVRSEHKDYSMRTFLFCSINLVFVNEISSPPLLHLSRHKRKAKNS